MRLEFLRGFKKINTQKKKNNEDGRKKNIIPENNEVKKEKKFKWRRREGVEESWKKVRMHARERAIIVNEEEWAV